MRNVMQLCDTVRETSFAIHRYLKHGHLEKVYENALAHRLRKAGVDVQQQHPLAVYDEDGTLIGDYYADLLVDTQLIVELKAAKTLAGEHVAQLLGYLRASPWNTVCSSTSVRRRSRYANSPSASQEEIEEFPDVQPQLPFASFAPSRGQRGT